MTENTIISVIFLFADCAQNVEISGVSNGSAVPAGSVLSCSAEGHPPPTYQWKAVSRDVKVTGSSVTVQRADTYYVLLTCTASNTVTHADGTTEECSTSSAVYFRSEFSTELYIVPLIWTVAATSYAQNQKNLFYGQVLIKGWADTQS